MSKKPRVVTNVLFNWANLVVNLGIAFFMAPFIVHKLGNVYYGIWILMMQFTGYLGLLESGVRESVIKYVARHHADGDSDTLNRLVSSAVSMYGVLGLASLLVASAVGIVLPVLFNLPESAVPTARIVVLITGITVAQGFAFNTFPGILMGLQRFDVFSRISIALAFVRAALILVFLSQGFGIIALGLIQLGMSLFTNLLILRRCKKELPALRVRVPHRPLSDYRAIFRYSSFVLLNNASQRLIFFSNALVIGHFLDAAAITFYAIAGNLIEYLRQFVRSMARVFNPLTSELDARNERGEIREVLVRGTRYALLLGLPICTVYAFMGRRFIELWMGSEYADRAFPVLLVLAATHAVSLPHYTVNNVLYGLSRHNVMAYSRACEAVANLVLSVYLVQRMGILGVAVGTAITHTVVVLLVLPPLVCRIVEMPLVEYLLQGYLRPLLSAVPFVLCCYFWNRYYPASSLVTFFAQVAVTLPLFAASAWFVALEKRDRRDVSATIRRLLP